MHLFKAFWKTQHSIRIEIFESIETVSPADVDNHVISTLSECLRDLLAFPCFSPGVSYGFFRERSMGILSHRVGEVLHLNPDLSDISLIARSFDTSRILASRSREIRDDRLITKDPNTSLC